MTQDNALHHVTENQKKEKIGKADLAEGCVFSDHSTVKQVAQNNQC